MVERASDAEAKVVVALQEMVQAGGDAAVLKTLQQAGPSSDQTKA